MRLKEPSELTYSSPQPPKRRGAPTSSSTTTAPKRARSKLAKENDITAEEENEIKEVFQLFADANEDFPTEKDGVMPREDVRKAMVYARSPRKNLQSRSEHPYTPSSRY